MGHHRVGGSLLGLVRNLRRLDPADPVSQCLAPRLCRTYATETALPSTPVPSVKATRINPNVDPDLYSPPKVLTTLHSWPALEPTRFVWYGSEFLHVPLRRDLLHRAVIFEGDATRLGTAYARHRTDIPGSNRKVLPQKGTGKARAGDSKSPIRRGGGVAHGPKPRDFSTELPLKIYDRAWRTALSYRYRKGELMVVDDRIRLLEDRTAHHLENVLVSNRLTKSLLVPMEIEEDTKEAMEQLGKYGKMKDVEDVDVKDLLGSQKVIIERKALDRLLLKHSSDLRDAYDMGKANGTLERDLPWAEYWREKIAAETP